MSKAKKPTVDDITRKKLLYAKRFYQHGEEHARRPEDSFQRIVAVHQFHAAVEIALKAVYAKYAFLGKIERAKGKKGLKQLYFEELLKAIKPLCRWITVPTEDFLLNKLDEKRHMAQHEAEPIASEHLPEYQVHTKDFLDECFLKEFGAKFEDFDLVDAVSDSKLRQVLIWAKELIELEKYEDSVVFSKLAYRIGVRYVKVRASGMRDLSYSVDAELSWGFENDELDTLRDSVSSAFSLVISEIEEVIVLLLTVGRAGGLHNYRSLLRIAPDIALLKSGEVVTREIPGHSYVLQKSESKRVRNYVLNCIIAWQEVGIHPKWVEEDLKYFEWAKNQIEAKRKEAAK